MSQAFSVEKLCQSSPVLALRGYVSAEIAAPERPADERQIQFAIARIVNTRGGAQGRIVFVSD